MLVLHDKYFSAVSEDFSVMASNVTFKIVEEDNYNEVFVIVAKDSVTYYDTYNMLSRKEKKEIKKLIGECKNYLMMRVLIQQSLLK